METTICNLCGQSQNHVYAIVDELMFGQKGVSTKLVQCDTCSLVYQNPRPTIDEMSMHYPPEYDSYTDYTHEKKKSWLTQQSIDYGFRKRSRIITRHKASGSLLDIGCATGAFLLGMQEHDGWRLAGVEVTDKVAKIARVNYGLDVFAGTLEEAAFADSEFDVVTLWDVLEHLHDPTASLNEIYRILELDGLLVIRVPNLASWDAALFGEYWAGLDAPRHLYIFTPNTLEALLMRANFKIVDKKCMSGGYMMFVLGVRFFLKAKNAPLQIQSLIRRLLYHPITRLITAPFFMIPDLLLRGPHLVIIAQKSELD